MAKKRKPRTRRPWKKPRDRATLVRLVSMALNKKMAEKPGLSLGKYIADRFWQDVLRGRPKAYCNWQKLRQLAEMYDEQAALVIEICGGLPEAWAISTCSSAKSSDGG